MNTNTWLLPPVNVRERHISPTSTLLPPVDVQTNHLQDGAFAGIGLWRTIGRTELQNFQNYAEDHYFKNDRI